VGDGREQRGANPRRRSVAAVTRARAEHSVRVPDVRPRANDVETKTLGVLRQRHQRESVDVTTNPPLAPSVVCQSRALARPRTPFGIFDSFGGLGCWTSWVRCSDDLVANDPIPACVVKRHYCPIDV
jgi:hypothetical protein